MPNTVDEFQKLATNVGLMTLSWAWAENVLAYTIGIIIAERGPIHGHKEAPLSLNRRLNAFRRAFRDLPILHALQEESTMLAERFEKLGRRRHDFVHGAVIQMHKGTFESTTVRVYRGDNVIDIYRFNETDPVLLEGEIAKLSDDATAFMKKVVTLLQA